MIPVGVLFIAVATAQVVSLPLADFRKIDRDSGEDNYYRVVTDQAGSRIAADYHSPMESETFGVSIPAPLRRRIDRLRWRWRVRAFPRGGDDCVKQVADSAAGVFLTFHSGLKWILIKYIWSTKHPVGAVCDARDSMFVKRATTVLETDATLGTWRSEEIDPSAEYVRHFGGRPENVPDFVGVGLFTDGDQTKSDSSADYTDFSLTLHGTP